MQAREAHAVGGRRPRGEEPGAVHVEQIGKCARKRRLQAHVALAAKPQVVVHDVDPQRAQLVARRTPRVLARAARLLDDAKEIKRLRHFDDAKDVHPGHGALAAQARHRLVDKEVHAEERERAHFAVAQDAVVRAAVGDDAVRSPARALLDVAAGLARAVVVLHHLQQVDELLERGREPGFLVDAPDKAERAHLAGRRLAQLRLVVAAQREHSALDHALAHALCLEPRMHGHGGLGVLRRRAVKGIVQRCASGAGLLAPPALGAPARRVYAAHFALFLHAGAATNTI